MNTPRRVPTKADLEVTIVELRTALGRAEERIAALAEQLSEAEKPKVPENRRHDADLAKRVAELEAFLKDAKAASGKREQELLERIAKLEKPTKVEAKPQTTLTPAQPQSALVPLRARANDMKREVISFPAPLQDADDEGWFL
jgi:chromosome segregation ATPase